MSAVGLTAGGFYAHFRSKDALVADAIDEAGEQAAQRWHRGLEGLRGRTYARALLGRYLSPEHRDDRAGGCILPSLGAEMPRAKRSGRRRFEQRLVAMIEHVGERMQPPVLARHEPEAAVRREDVIATIALSVGGLVLSRAVLDQVLSDEILSASRRAAARLLGVRRSAPRRHS
jgi:TetR/AcrR family transcriptional repressor of nem operon